MECALHIDEHQRAFIKEKPVRIFRESYAGEREREQKSFHVCCNSRP